MSRDPRCRCGSRKKASRCCAPFHQGRPAPTPVALMRSRYAAYAHRHIDYIVETTDPDGPRWQDPRDQWHAEIAAFCDRTAFLGLEIIDAPPPTEHEGFVTFRAHLDQAGADATFTERSRFTRRGDRWRYHSGERIA